jgi:hypothetical protein
MRGTMRRITDGGDYPLPATIDDPGIFDENRYRFDKRRVRQAAESVER